MPHYFFDTRDNDELIRDEIGLELADLEAVKVEASRSLAEMAEDVLPSSSRRELAVEVRDESQTVLRAVLTFEAVVLGPS